ncbi:metal ABC transporter substrate-binding protein [Rubritalea tangerina]|uniref:Metal ABC transporter substrate-binding protein n=2 Tax=Rubritalea tangerina TaxID=430798 RepID=A0ABW4ZBD2_9BACT
MKILSLLLLIVSAMLCSAKTKVATLSPLLADLARQVGGEHVTVIDLMGPNGDPHTFRPTPSKLTKAQGATLYLAFGKNLEPFLPKLKSIVGNKAMVLEVGRDVPSLRISGKSAVYACCPKHVVGALDPHWWHSIEAWRRATTSVEKALSKIDPANAASYKSRSSAYRRQLSGLKSWAKKEIASIPRSQRHLATAHAAFGYFCKEFGFKSIPVQGLNKEQSASPQYISEAIATIKKNKVKAIFPEKGANTKSLKTISQSTGVKIAPALYADTANSIIGMFQHNVTTIKNALK